MPSFPNLGENATVPDIFRMSPKASNKLMEMHQSVMRGESPLTNVNLLLLTCQV